MKKVLLVTDVQQDFCPGGSLAVQGGDQIIEPINRLSRSGIFDLIVATQDWHPPKHISFASRWGEKPYTISEAAGQMVWPDHCIQGSSGADFHPSLDQRPFVFILRKGMNPDLDSYSAFLENDKKTETGLYSLLPKNCEVYLTGIATDVCVFQSAMDALKGEYKVVYLVEDACAGVTPEGTAQALDDMKKAGIKIMKTKDLLD